MWGLKGQIDIMALLRVECGTGNNRKDVISHHLFPLELKTGHRIKQEHYAQVALYSLLINDRYSGAKVAGSTAGQVPFVSGMLLHMSEKLPARGMTKSISRGVSHNRSEACALIHLRNQYASAMSNFSNLSCNASLSSKQKCKTETAVDSNLDYQSCTSNAEVPPPNLPNGSRRFSIPPITGNIRG